MTRSPITAGGEVNWNSPGGLWALRARLGIGRSRGLKTVPASWKLLGRIGLHTPAASAPPGDGPVLAGGCRWRDVPPVYGPQTTIYHRYNRWSQRRVRQRIFEKMAAAGPIPDVFSIDSSQVKAHRRRAAEKRGSLRKRSA
jgi:hypothetical protein